MQGSHNPLKAMRWIRDHLDDPDLVLIDCRYRLNDAEYGFKAYMQDHIRGAFFMDLNRDLSSPVSRHGGRHPMPDINEFVSRLENIGVSDNSTVIAYDDNWSGAARIYFLLKYIGFPEAYVMNGLYDEWKNSGFPVEGKRPLQRKGKITPNIQDSLKVDMEYVKENLESITLVDCRSNDRYRGENETIDPVAGHIPGAINIPFSESHSGGHYLGTEEMRRKFQSLPEDAVLYCGSGVTACVNFVSMIVAGKTPRIYSGSWSDWISYPDNPVE